MSKEKPTTKICKHCKSEIPYEAKVCPQCRKKQGGKLKWVIIALVAILFIGAMAGNGEKEPSKVGEVDEKVDNSNGQVLDNEPEQEQKEEEIIDSSDEEGETVFKKGDIAEMNDVQVTLTDYTESTGSDYNQPTEGNVYLLAEFEIVNNTSGEVAVSSMMSFEAYADDYSLNYSIGALLEKDGNQLDGTIAAGKKLKGWIGWEVPEDYQNVEIHFKDDVWSNDKFVFVIEK